MTKPERDRIAKIRFDLAQEGITPERWELEALARGATVIYGDKNSNTRLLMSGRDSQCKRSGVNEQNPSVKNCT